MSEFEVIPEEAIDYEESTFVEDAEKEKKEWLHLVDGDIIAYRCSAATDGRFYLVGDERFKYKKDAADYVAVTKAYTAEDIELHFKPEPISHCIKLMQNMLKHMPNAEIWISPKRNFRYDLNPDYKCKRATLRRPAHLAAAKAWLLERGDYMENLEADDALVIRSTQLDKDGIPHVIASVDKDLKQKHGWHFHLESHKYTYITEAEARKALWLQICVGDSTDDIYSPKGLGPKRAMKVLDIVDWNLHSDWVIFKGVLELYKMFTKREKVTEVDEVAVGVVPLLVPRDETDREYITRCVRHLHLVASQVYLRRSKDDVWQLPSKESSEE